MLSTSRLTPRADVLGAASARALFKIVCRLPSIHPPARVPAVVCSGTPCRAAVLSADGGRLF